MVQCSQGSSQGGSDLWSLTNTFAASGRNNGNVTQQQTVAGSANITQVYSYDGVNRLLTAAENASNPANPVCGGGTSNWCLQFSYDVFGNRLVATRNNAGPWTNEPGAYDTTTNRITGTGWGYDTANQRGTIMADSGGDSFAYDAEDRIYSANGTSYVYDGDGRRVGKIPSTGSANATWYLYDATGELAAEYNAPVAAAPTTFITADHLGTTRVVTTLGSPAQVSERHDFYPFGQEILVTASDPRNGVVGYAPAVETPWLFTGKERDAESGLDYFGERYMSSAQGRFTSPDEPLYDQSASDPQSWNLYSYVRNNPLRFTDPDGHECVTFDNGTKGDDGKGTVCSTADLRPQQVNVTDTPWPSFMEPGIVYGGPKANITGGCPLGSCHTLDGAFPAFSGPRINVVPYALMGLGAIFSNQLTSTELAGKLGAEGESAAGLSGPKVGIRIPGTANLRFPDRLTATTVTEVKNVARQSLTGQLRDDITFAKATGRTVELWVRPSTSLSGPLQQSIIKGDITLKFIPGAK